MAQILPHSNHENQAKNLAAGHAWKCRYQTAARQVERKKTDRSHGKGPEKGRRGNRAATAAANRLRKQSKAADREAAPPEDFLHESCRAASEPSKLTARAVELQSLAPTSVGATATSQRSCTKKDGGAA